MPRPSPLAAPQKKSIISFNAHARAHHQAGDYYPIMGLSKKRKQQLSHITARSLESRKHRKVDNENQRQKEILRRQRKEEDYWDEYEDFYLESSTDESDNNEPSPDKPSSDEEEEVREDNRKEKGVYEGLGDNEGGVQLETEERTEERTFKPRWKSDAGDYLRGVRGCGSSTTKKREKRREKELEKSASQSQSIVDMFSAQHSQKRLHHSALPPTPLPDLFPSPEKSSNTVINKVETKFELQTQAAHDLGELLRLKTQQIDKYGYELSYQSSYYRHHQMIRCFLWM